MKMVNFFMINLDVEVYPQDVCYVEILTALPKIYLKLLSKPFHIREKK